MRRICFKSSHNQVKSGQNFGQVIKSSGLNTPNWDDERNRSTSFGEPYGAICEQVEAKEYEEMAGMVWANHSGEQSSLAKIESSSAADCGLR